jgi:hypothetical protein
MRNSPDALLLYLAVFMDKNISLADNLSPGQFGMAIAKLGRDFAGSLTDYLQKTFNGKLGLAVLQVRLKIHSGYHLPDHYGTV